MEQDEVQAVSCEWITHACMCWCDTNARIHGHKMTLVVVFEALDERCRWGVLDDLELGHLHNAKHVVVHSQVDLHNPHRHGHEVSEKIRSTQVATIESRLK